MTNLLGTAITIAATAFEFRRDKGGEPYILHCLRVMNSLPADDWELQAMGVLHDVLEDFPDTYDIEYLRKQGFSDRIIKALDILNHRDEDDYLEVYIKKIALNKDAKLVKLADLQDNSQITRLKGLRKKDFDRMEKYHKAFTYLKD